MKMIRTFLLLIVLSAVAGVANEAVEEELGLPAPDQYITTEEEKYLEPMELKSLIPEEEEVGGFQCNGVTSKADCCGKVDTRAAFRRRPRCVVPKTRFSMGNPMCEVEDWIRARKPNEIAPCPTQQTTCHNGVPGECVVADRIKQLGKFKTLETAQAAFNSDAQCKGGLLMYSGYSYSWGTYCCKANAKKSGNKNWKTYGGNCATDNSGGEDGSLYKYAYWDSGRCGPKGDDANWDICGTRRKNCPAVIDAPKCKCGKAYRKVWHPSTVRLGKCSYYYYAEYYCGTHGDGEENKNNSWYYLAHGAGSPVRCGTTPNTIECASNNNHDCFWGKMGRKPAYSIVANVKAAKPYAINCPGWKPSTGEDACMSLGCYSSKDNGILIDESKNGMKCQWHPSEHRVFDLRSGAATKPACDKMCLNNPRCVAYSAIFGNWCIGCDTTLTDKHPGSTAFKVDRDPIALCEVSTTLPLDASCSCASATTNECSAGKFCYDGKCNDKPKPIAVCVADGLTKAVGDCFCGTMTCRENQYCSGNKCQNYPKCSGMNKEKSKIAQCLCMGTEVCKQGEFCTNFDEDEYCLDKLPQDNNPYVEKGSGYCGDWVYLQEGGYPAVLSVGDELYSSDPALECMNRCLASAGQKGKNGVISNQAFYLIDNGDKCACSSGPCNKRVPGPYTAYGIINYKPITGGSGYCKDWVYLLEGAYPPHLQASDRLHSDDPARECMTRCLNAVGKYGTNGVISNQAFYLLNSGERCACSSGTCSAKIPGPYTSYQIVKDSSPVTPPQCPPGSDDAMTTYYCTCGSKRCPSGTYCYGGGCHNTPIPRPPPVPACLGGSQKIMFPCMCNGQQCNGGYYCYNGRCNSRPEACEENTQFPHVAECMCGGNTLCPASSYCYDGKCARGPKPSPRPPTCSRGHVDSSCMCGSTKCTSGKYCYGKCQTQPLSCKNHRFESVPIDEACTCGGQTCSPGKYCYDHKCTAVPKPAELKECNSMVATEDCQCENDTCRPGEKCESGECVLPKVCKSTVRPAHYLNVEAITENSRHPGYYFKFDEVEGKTYFNKSPTWKYSGTYTMLNSCGDKWEVKILRNAGGCDDTDNRLQCGRASNHSPVNDWDYIHVGQNVGQNKWIAIVGERNLMMLETEVGGRKCEYAKGACNSACGPLATKHTPNRPTYKKARKKCLGNCRRAYAVCKKGTKAGEEVESEVGTGYQIVSGHSFLVVVFVLLSLGFGFYIGNRQVSHKNIYRELLNEDSNEVEVKATEAGVEMSYQTM